MKRKRLRRLVWSSLCLVPLAVVRPIQAVAAYPVRPTWQQLAEGRSTRMFVPQYRQQWERLDQQRLRNGAFLRKLEFPRGRQTPLNQVQSDGQPFERAPYLPGRRYGERILPRPGGR